MIKLLCTSCLAILLLTFAPHGLMAQDGTLDPAFGSGGKTISNIGTSHDYANASALQSDGKLVVAGYAYNGSRTDFAVARYNTDGSLDAGFNGTGKTTTDFNNFEDYGTAIVIQANGKILVGGYANSGFSQFAIARYNTDGTLDNTFGTGGKLSVSIGWGHAYGYAMALQADGKIVLAGSAYMGSRYTLSIARFNTDGTADNTFGTNGAIVSLVGTSGSDAIYGVALQSDGKIVVAGKAGFGGADVFTLARYSATGTLDNTFGTAGLVTVNAGTGNDTAKSFTIQPDGKIIVAGTGNNGTVNNAVVMRFTTSGALDNSFNSNGVQALALGANSMGNNLLLRTDGKMWLTGVANSGVNNDFAVAFLNADGTLNTSFAGTGKLLVDINNGYDAATGLAIQSDGNLLISGYAFISLNNSNYNFAVARYSATGIVDATYGTAGMVNTNIGTNQDNAYSVAVQTDGKLVVGGYAFTGSGNFFALLRYNSDATLDPAFGISGKVFTPVGNSATTPNDQAKTVLLQGSKIIAAGSALNTSNDFAVVRYNSDGSLDNTFGTAGKVMTDIGSNTSDYGQAAVLQPDGKIIVGGYTLVVSNFDFALVRYNTDGTLDNTFGTGGKVITPVGAGTSNDMLAGLALQADGKIVAVGASNNGSNNDFSVVRYNTDGTLDNTFNSTGKVLTDVATASIDAATGVSIQADGKIVVTGNVYTAGKYVFTVVRYNADGSLDNSFNTTGKVTSIIGTSNAFSQTIIAQTDNKILVGGYANASNTDFAIARYTSTGAPDNTFGTNGVVISAIGTGTDNGQSMALQGNGNIILAGSSNNGLNNDFAVARFVNTVTALPLQWGSFTAVKAGTGILLKWETLQEQNTKDFLVQHSTNGTGWETLTTIIAKGAGSNTYSWLHENLSGSLHYYRLLQRDLDDKQNYSGIRTIRLIKQTAAFALLGNPVSANNVQVSVIGDGNTSTTLSFYTLSGILLWQKSLTDGIHSIDMGNLARGLYIMKAGNETKKVMLK